MMERDNALLSQIEAMMNSKLQSFEERIGNTQREISQSQISTIQSNLTVSDIYTFKKKGHEQQYRVNAQVLDKLRQADGFMREASSTLQSEAAEQAINRVSEGMDILSHRQKCIKLADSSEHGWRVVQEYEAHPLAENSDDEKKINRAQIQADRKVRQERRARGRRYQPYSVPNSGTNATSSTTVTQQTNGTVGRKPGSCFRCGKPGHWRKECLAQDVQSDRNIQISRLVSCVSSVENIVENGYFRRKESFESQHCSLKISVIETLQEKEKSVVSPVGRIRACLKHWENAGANAYILDIVESGYKLPFIHLPVPVELRNNKSARDNGDFVSEEIQRLLSKGCIKEVSSAPTVVNPLTVAINRSGKKRLVLDCRHLNLELFKYKCCFENQSVAKNIFSKGDFMFRFDIKGAYHHVMIFPEHTTYLGFAWVENGVKRYFIYVVLPFGVSTAGFIFTKLLRVCVSKWRSMGISIVVFLDDGLGGADNLETAMKASNFVKKDLIDFGFLLADDKCHWIPSMNTNWLGYIWNTLEGTVKVSEDRIARTLGLLEELIRSVSMGSLYIQARKVARLVGHVISMQSVMGTNVRLFTRALYDCVCSRASWDAPVKMSTSGLSEMIFWRENLLGLNCSYMNEIGQRSPNASVGGNGKCDVSDANVFVDASGSGFGGFVEGVEGCEIAGSWLSNERDLSSTWRELESVYRVISSCASELQNKRVVVNTDNKNVSSILKVGSKKPYLQNVSVKLYDVCSKNQIEMIPNWLPRAENTAADMLSRCSDSDDWSIADYIFVRSEKLWGPHTVDRFACHYNSKCLRIEHSIADEIIQAGVTGTGLRNLTASMAGYLIQSRSENTVRKYYHYFQKWEQFVTEKGGQVIPASPILISLFLTDLLDKKCSYNVISTIVYSFKWVHSLRNLGDPTENLFVKNLLDCAKRTAKKVVNRKSPVTTQMLIELCDKHIDSTDVLVVRDLCMILLGYTAFLRYDEIRNLVCSDITFKDDFFSIRIRKSKTDQYRHGDEVVVSKGTTSACPFLMLQRYLSLTEQSIDSNFHLFRPCFRSKSLCRLIYKDKPLSYTRAKECIVARLQEVASDLNLGLHSLRAGGATHAANSGVIDRCWKRHGRWKSDSSKDMYVADSLDQRLAVSRGLDL